MKYLNLILIISLCFSCKDEIVEVRAFRIIKNDSDYIAQVTFEGDRNNLNAVLNPGDSIYSEGTCLQGVEIGCHFSWTDDNYTLAEIRFDSTRVLTYQAQVCGGLRNPIGIDGNEAEPDACGFNLTTEFPDMHWLYLITNEDYALADSLGN